MFPSTLFDWVRQTDIEGGGRDGVPKEQAEDLQQLPRHNRLLEHEKEVHARAAPHLSQANLRLNGSPQRFTRQSAS